MLRIFVSIAVALVLGGNITYNLGEFWLAPTMAHALEAPLSEEVAMNRINEIVRKVDERLAAKKGSCTEISSVRVCAYQGEPKIRLVFSSPQKSPEITVASIRGPGLLTANAAYVSAIIETFEPKIDPVERSRSVADFVSRFGDGGSGGEWELKGTTWSFAAGNGNKGLDSLMLVVKPAQEAPAKPKTRVGLPAAPAPVAGHIPMTPDAAMERINRLAANTFPTMVAQKKYCREFEGALKCRYRSKTGPGINFLADRATSHIKLIIIADMPGLSVNGALYIPMIVEALDSSMDLKEQQQKVSQFLEDYTNKQPTPGEVVMRSPAFAYIMTWTKEGLLFYAGPSNASASPSPLERPD